MNEDLNYAQTFWDLVAYKKSILLAGRVFSLTLTFPKTEIYSPTDQIRRSSRSIGANIAEAWGKRRYVNQFKYVLTTASAEVYETEHWIDISYQCEYIDDETRSSLIRLCGKINSLLGGMISKADLFCQPE